MKNFSKQLSSFFAAFAIVFTMGTATTTTSAEATCHWGGCHTSCSTLEYYENYYKDLANYYGEGSWHYNYYMNKSNYYKDLYNHNQQCQVTPPPVATGTLCGYVFVNGKADRSDGTLVTITQPDGTLLTTTVNSDGKWSISNVQAGNVSVYVDESHFNVPPNRLIQVYGENSSSAVVVANQLNDGKVDNYKITDL